MCTVLIRIVFFGPALAAVFCLSTPTLRAEDWPEWLGSKRDAVWRERGLLDQFPKDGPKVEWRMPIHNGYAGPAVVGDRVYVMEKERPLDSDGKPAKPTREGIPGKERILCLSAVDGKPIWKDEYDAPYKISYPNGPRVTPLVRDGRVYTLGAVGDLRCLDAAKGDVLWSKNVATEYNQKPPVWGWATHLLLDGDLLYCLVGGEGSAVVAFNKKDGKEVWKALSTKEIGYSPPMMYDLAGKKTLVVWLSETINGLDPEKGTVLWKHAYPEENEVHRPAVNISTVIKDKDRLFLTSFYHGPMMLEIAGEKPQAKVVWQGKSKDPNKPDGLNCVMATPFLKDGCVYGIDGMGALQCYKADSGEKLWETKKVLGEDKAFCGTAFLVQKGDQFILFSDHGDLILAELSPKEYKEISRAHLLEPTQKGFDRDVVWSHPAFARQCVFARNDKEIICVSLAAEKKAEGVKP
jgi:outer membrane protein assembly factor BamB